MPWEMQLFLHLYGQRNCFLQVEEHPGPFNGALMRPQKVQSGGCSIRKIFTRSAQEKGLGMLPELKKFAVEQTTEMEKFANHDLMIG